MTIDSFEFDWLFGFCSYCHDNLIFINALLFIENSGFDEIVTHPRKVESARQEVTKNQKKREKKEARKELTKLQKEEELKRLKSLKKKEIMEKIKEIELITGNVSIDQDFLQEEFDPDKYDQKMASMFSDDYYNEEEDDDLDVQIIGGDEANGKFDCQTGEGFGFLTFDCFDISAKVDYENEGEGNDNEEDQQDYTHDEVDEGEANSEKGLKRKQKVGFGKARRLASEKKKLEEMLDEFYKLNYEDLVW